MRVTDGPQPIEPNASDGAASAAEEASLSTRLQEHLDDSVRGRLMALYMMSFGGTVPIGLLAAGPIASAASITAVLIAGAVAAVLLAVHVRPRQLPFTVSRSTTGHVLEEPG